MDDDPLNRFSRIHGMKVVIAPDSFKENLSAGEVAEAIARGVRGVCPECECVCVPMADGGEGTVQALVDATGGRIIEKEVTGPLGERVRAGLGVTGDGGTAIIEMAWASGLPLVSVGRRNPMVTTTLGTGELIRAALDLGVRKILIGIGGSATVDGGVGMAQALGVRFEGSTGEIGLGGGALGTLERIDVTGLDRRVRQVQIEVACDVANELVGALGAAQVYGPQKGATAQQVEELDRNLGHLADIIERDLGVSVRGLPGSGAAGGLGAGLVAFLGAKLRPGVEMVVEAVRLEERLAGAELVITAEGKLDRQSAFGKTPVGVARVAKKAGARVVALAAILEPGYESVFEHGIDACFAIADRPMGQEESMARATELLTEAAQNVVRLYLASKQSGAERES